MELPESYMHWSVAAVMAVLLLGYPIKTKDVHPIVQVAICACLTMVALSLALSAFVSESSSNLVLAASFLLSLVTVIVPAVGALAGLSTTSALLTAVLVSDLDSALLRFVLVSAAAVGGASVLFVNKEMFLYWQLIAPPVVGGFLAMTAVRPWLDDSMYLAGIWTVSAIVSVLLHIRRRRVNSWLDNKKEEAIYSKESQIATLMRSANPEMNADEFEKLKEKLLGAVGGERDQVDRIVYGGGMY
jgi:hypothetical protein